MIEFRILGALEVDKDGRPLALGGPKQRALLAMLLLNANEVVASERLIRGLWADPPATARTALQGHVLRLRKLVGRDVLVTQPPGYLLRIRPEQLDLRVFERLVADAREALEPTIRSRLLHEALSLWRGEPHAEFAEEPFARVEIARLEEQRVAALEERIDADLALGEHAALVAELEALVARHPLRERLRGQLMLALYRSGRQAGALDVYRQGRVALAEQLGLEPGPALQGLEGQILRQDPALDPPRAAAAPTAPTLERLRSPPLRRRALLASMLAGVLAAAVSIPVFVVAGGTSKVRPATSILGNELVAIDPATNSVTAVVPVGARPVDVVFAAGSLWVANLDDATISRVDPQTARVTRTIATLPGRTIPAALAAGRDGVWYVGSSPRTGTATNVGRIDPQFDDVTQTIGVGGSAFGGGNVGIAAARGGVWITAGGLGPLSRIDPARGKIVEALDTRSCCPADVAVGAGAVWVVDPYANTVTRIDGQHLVTPINVGRGPVALATGLGAVWVAVGQDNAVVRIDPSTNAVLTTIPVGKSPSAVAVAADAVWVANSRDGTVSRIDTTTNEVAETIEIGGSPQRLAVGGGRIWVTVQRADAGRTSAAAGGTARLTTQHDVDSLDPALAYTPLEESTLSGSLSWQILYATCAKLLNYPDRPAPVGSQLVPEIAESLPTRSADRKTYTFTIRQGFRFSPPSNETVTPKTFKHAIERSLSPEMNGPASLAAVAAGTGARATLDDVVGAKEYAAGKAAHIAGIVAGERTLTIRLVRPAPDLPDRLALPFVCAVPVGTPLDPRGVRLLPSAGPYYIASYEPGQKIVIRRNPNYGGSRPRHLEEIHVAIGVSGGDALEEIEAGEADYALDGVPAAAHERLQARYGAGSPAAKAGRQRYFVNPTLGLYFLAFNTSRPLFSEARLRRAVSYAVDRRALTRFASFFIPAEPTDQYLPPGTLGFEDAELYPPAPDLRAARRLAGPRRTKAVLYTLSSSLPVALLVRSQLADIGIEVDVKTFPFPEVRARLATRGEPFDLAINGWGADFPDPGAFLNPLLQGRSLRPTGNTNIAYFDDAGYNRKLAGAADLSGRRRYLVYGRLERELARDAAPLVALANPTRRDFFSERIGCQVYHPVYGMDLAALCLRP